MNKKITPLGNRVLIKRQQQTTTKGGIYLPESAQEKPRQGEVIAVGPGKYDEKGTIKPLHIQVGDQVLFSSYAGSEVKMDDTQEEYLILSEDDILGTLISK